MSNLYCSISSDTRKSEPTSQGRSEISTHIRGWNMGIYVEAFADKKGKTHFFIYQTNGSNGGVSRKALTSNMIGEVIES